jgi:hypothetical protein
MVEKGVTAPELAKRMNVPEDRIRAIFSDECALAVRDLARVYHALGVTPPSL